MHQMGHCLINSAAFIQSEHDQMKIPSVKNQNLQAECRRVMLLPALMILREEVVWGKAILPTIFMQE